MHIARHPDDHPIELRDHIRRELDHILSQTLRPDIP